MFVPESARIGNPIIFGVFSTRAAARKHIRPDADDYIVERHLDGPESTGLPSQIVKGYKGRRKGVAIRKGSVLKARKETGLSLGEVANGQVSRTLIHLVEKGRVKPSLETLTLIARSTGKPVGFFLVAK